MVSFQKPREVYPTPPHGQRKFFTLASVSGFKKDVLRFRPLSFPLPPRKCSEVRQSFVQQI